MLFQSERDSRSCALILRTPKLRLRQRYFRHVLRSENGDTLITVLIASAIAGMLMMTIVESLTTQNKSQKYLSQKMELLELKNTLTGALLSTATCKKMVNEFKSNISVSSGGTYSPIPISELKSTLPSEPAIVSVVSGMPTLLPGTVTGLKIKSINFVVDGKTASVPNQYLGHFEIQADENSTVRQMRPVIVRQIVKTDAAGKVIDCLSTSVPTCPTGNVLSGLDAAGDPICYSLTCPAGQVVAGISAAGVTICKDGTGITKNALGLSCASGQVLTGITAGGTASCTSMVAAASAAPAPVYVAPPAAPVYVAPPAAPVYVAPPAPVYVAPPPPKVPVCSQVPTGLYDVYVTCSGAGLPNICTPTGGAFSVVLRSKSTCNFTTLLGVYNVKPSDYRFWSMDSCTPLYKQVCN